MAATRLAGNRATVFEALAATGGMPTASMAGKVKKVAPAGDGVDGAAGKARGHQQRDVDGAQPTASGYRQETEQDRHDHPARLGVTEAGTGSIA